MKDLNQISKYMLGVGCLMFTLDHPLVVAFGALFYLFNEYVSSEEKEMLKDFASKGSTWLIQLNKQSVEKGVSMKQGREVVSEISETLFTNLSARELSRFMEDDLLKDKVSRFIIEELNSEVDYLNNWDAYPLIDTPYLQESDWTFFKFWVPDFDWSQDYTYKAHRQLFKTLKAKFRNTDGSIKYEDCNKAALLYEEWLYGVMTEADTPNYGQDASITELIFTEKYKEYTNV